VGIAFLTGWIGLYAQQLTGTHNITGTSAFNESGGQFATIKEAFDSLRARGVGPGGVTFVVQESWRTTNSSSGRDAEPSTIELRTYPGAGPNNPVTLTFAGLSDTVYFAKAPTTTAGNRFVFRFTGTFSHFTLDGAGKLIVKNTASGGTTTGGIGFVSNTSTPLNIDAITVQNVIIHGNSRANTYAGIYIGDDGTLGTAVSATSSIGTARGVTIQGCTIDSVSRPILVAGRPANTQNIEVLNNELGHPTDTAGWCAASGIGAIHIRGTVGVSVRGNVVHPERSSFSSVAGIRLDSCEAALVERNWIKGVVYNGTGGLGTYGIALTLPASYISSAPQTTVLNNMIAGIYADGDRNISGGGAWVISGIFVTAPSAVTNAQVRLIHNSINLFDDPVLSGDPKSSYVGVSSGITLGATIQGGVVIDGNLIQNRLSPRQRRNGEQAAYGILIYNSSLASSTIDYQCYRINATPANNYIGCLGNPATAANNHPTLSAWQTAISGEANGIDHAPAGDVPFLSDTNLHLNSSAPSLAINAGNTAYNGAIDFDGQTRPLPTNPPGSVNNPPDPGSAPDIGADELDGTPFSCPSSLQAPDIVVTATYPPLAGSDYLWGQQVEIDTTGTNSPTPSGTLYVIYSLDGGTNWTRVNPSITSFPVTITLPPLSPPTYKDTMLIAVIAEAPGFCSLTPDTSSTRDTIILTDRPGNRAATAIPITLDPSPSGPGMWTATISDSTSGLGLSNEYNAATGARWGSASRDLFFALTLPECLDSLVLNTCSGNTNFDTRIHFINATTNDTITNDDQGSSCTSAGGSVNPNWLSQLVVFGLPNALQVTQTVLSDIGIGSSAKVVRDTALLVSGHTIYIVVEGFGSTNQGKFELTITGYKMRPTGISVNTSYSAPVCKGSSTFPLDASIVNAPSGTSPSTYIWEVDGTAQTDANTSTYVFDPNTEGVFTIVAKAVYPNPNNAPNNNVCPDDTIMSDPVTITVEDTARAQIVDPNANDAPVSNQTLSFTAGSTVTLKAKSSQNPDNSYTWKQYNSIPPPPSGTPDFTSTDNPLIISNISAGSYTVILEAVRGTGACGTTRDTVYLSVTTGLRTDAGTFSIFPNPNTGAFTIVAPAMDTYRIQVLDVAGRLVAEDAFTGSTHQMRLSLPAGMYQIRLVAGDKTQIGRLIITE
jgi:hypothetical protein